MMTTHVKKYCLVVAMTLAAGAGGPSIAQERVNSVPVSRSTGDVLRASLKLYDEDTKSWATIDWDNPELMVGQIVAVCATATRKGYISVWSRTLDGEPPVRIFPNDLTPEDRRRKGGEIAAGTEMCLGDARDGYGFEVLPPVAPAEVYLHWSPDVAGQFAPEDIPVIPDHGSSGSRSTGAPYSSATLRYRVAAN